MKKIAQEFGAITLLVLFIGTYCHLTNIYASYAWLFLILVSFGIATIVIWLWEQL